ncbi:MAG: hypothetical protein PVH19_09175, partial [Planctomycetia bacterium]
MKNKTLWRRWIVMGGIVAGIISPALMGTPTQEKKPAAPPVTSVRAIAHQFTVTPITLTYPQTKRIDHTDTYHGTTVADPYRWLEDDVRQSKEVTEWVKAENQVTNAFLEKIPQRDTIRKVITRLYNVPRVSTPVKVAGRYFFSKNDGL